jgi:hypothetical protein
VIPTDGGALRVSAQAVKAAEKSSDSAIFRSRAGQYWICTGNYYNIADVKST